MRRFLHLLIIVLLIFVQVIINSCRKKEQTSFPQTVYSHDISATSAIRMYTDGTEIHDTAVINRYVRNLHCFNLSSVDPSEYISFLSADSAIISDYTTKFSYTLNEGLFLLFSKNYYNIDPTDHLSMLLDTIQKYKSAKILIPAGTNLMNWARRAIWVAHGSYQDLLMSGISYKVSTYGTYQAGTMPNEFFEGSVASFRQGDTLAVQSYILHMAAR